VWRFWAGLVVGALVVWVLDIWRRGISSNSNQQIAFVIVSLFMLASIVGIWVERQRETQKRATR